MLKKLRAKTYNFLRWTEKWTKTDMIYFTKGGFWLTIGQMFSALSAFLLSIAFANLLPKETYGNYKYILSIASILSIPTLSGMTTAIAQSVAKGYDGSFKPALKARIKWGLLGAIVSLAFAIYYFYQENNILTFSFLISAIFLPLMDPLNSYDALLVGKKLFKTSTKYNIIMKFLATVGMISTIYLTKNIFLIVFSYFILYTVLRFILLRFTLHNIKLNNQIDQKTIPYGKHLSMMNVVSVIVSQLDKIMIFNRLGAIELGIYSFAIAMPEQIKGLLNNIQTLALPKFAQSSHQENRKSILIKMFKLSILVFPIIIIYIIAAPYIFKILFPKYLDSIIYSQIFAVSLLTISAGLPLTFLQSKAATKKLWQLNTLSPVIQSIIMIIGIYFYGLLGIIIARVISRVINFIIFLAMIEKE